MKFYSEPITVKFSIKPLLEKKPGVPAAFTWRGRSYTVLALLKEWHDYRTRGRMLDFYDQKRGNAPEIVSGGKGSWGVGRDYYRVVVDSGEVFDIYYDRKPKGKTKKGEWTLYRRVY
jgi:hypothetical protein